MSKNGTTRLLLGAMALVVAAAGALATMIRYNTAGLDQHEGKFGHQGMEERVRNIEEKVAPIPELRMAVARIETIVQQLVDEE